MQREHSLDELISLQVSSFLSLTELSKEIVAEIRFFFEHARGVTGYKWGSLTYQTCDSLGGKPEVAMSGAIAMEFYTLAADILDDIQDQDNDSMPWRRISLGESISTATCLLFLSYRAVERSTDDQIFRESCMALNSSGVRASDGQYLEFLLGRREDFVLATYLDIVKKKSGSLMGCACKIGAILAKVDEEVVGRLEEFGLNLGIMAQIRNDLRDFLTPGEKGDLFTRRKTLPVLYLLNTTHNQELKNLLLGKDNDPNSLISLKQLAVDEGAVEYCSVVHEVFRQNAIERLEAIRLPDNAKGQLMDLVRKTF